MSGRANRMSPRIKQMAGLLAAMLAGCAGVHERRLPMGETFPSVQGESLDGRQYSIPGDFSGRPALLLIGYKQNTQFDIDRWLLGLQQAGLQVEAYELPTIPGLFPGLFAGKIDEGMRSGIPAEDWAVVITIYKDAKRIAGFTGNRNGLPARVVLLDGAGRVIFFHDEGYSINALMRLQQTLEPLVETPAHDAVSAFEHESAEATPGATSTHGKSGESHVGN